ncbi:hypothetical protein RB195_015873 [Necator americanus]|uniref:ARF7 effector protein C-terminal domain-containing protein n=1 Tax=Necator americanus TaxID=51031 RepID=A0ABR1E972_NECAM
MKPVAVVELPPSNLRQRLISNRLYDRICTTPECKIHQDNNEGDCMNLCVVYMISCVRCGDEYIGETARPLCIQIKEILDGKRKSCDFTALGGHRVRRHNRKDFEVKVTILERELSTAARKTMEAFWIHYKDESQREMPPYYAEEDSEEGDIAETLAMNKV